MTTRTITREETVTVLKHLASGKAHHVVATIAGANVKVVQEIADEHGYPDRDLLAAAAAHLEAEIDAAGAPDEHPDAAAIARTATAAHTRPAAGDSTPPAAGPPLTRPDEIRVVLNTAKGHPSKRIQAQANRIFDQLDHLQVLLREDQEKHAEKRRLAEERAAEKRRAAEEKAEAAAEVARLKQELADAQAKLRGSTSAGGGHTTASNYDRDRTRAIRAWATEQGIAIATRGRIPAEVSAAYDAGHPRQDTAA